MLNQGIIIKKRDNGEYNQLITLYAKELGKVTVIAKSVKKNTSKQAGHLDAFNLVDFVFVAGRNYPIITSVQSIHTFSNIKSNLTKNALGFFILETIENLVYEHDNDPALWEFLLKKLNELEVIENLNGNLNKFVLDLQKGFVNIFGYGENPNGWDARNFLVSLSPRNLYSLLFIDSVLK